MTSPTCRALRLAMRTCYTGTAFLASVYVALVAHDGMGGPAQEPVLWAAACCWALAVTLEALTDKPHWKRA